MDIGHEETEALLFDTEKEIGRVYRRAIKEEKAKLKAFLDQFKADDAKFAQMVKDGKMTEDAYLKWRKTAIIQKKQYREMVNTLVHDNVNADKIAMSVVNGHTPEAYAINRNFGAFEVEKGSLIDTSFTLYDRQTVERLLREQPDLLPHPSVDIPKDLQWNRRKIREEVTQAILQGESIDNAANRLANVIGMNHAAAVRNARTAITGAQNAGRVDSYKQAQAMGIDLMQEWLATLDSHTRHSHAMMDGQKVNVGNKFSNGCRYPGDPEGPAEEIYNCRCTLVASLTGFDFAEGERDNRLGGMSYDDWKEMHANAYAEQETAKYLKSLMEQTPAGKSLSDLYGELEDAIHNATEYSASDHEFMNFSYDYWDSLSDKERRAVRDYTGSDYESMNAYLRGIKSESWMSNYELEDINNLTHVLDEQYIAEDTLLYRGMGSQRTLARALGIDEDDIPGIFEDGSIIGQSFIEKGFCSTGINQGKGWDKPVTMTIVAPSGTNGMYVDLVSSVPGEQEVLLQRGAIFRIVEAEDRGEWNYDNRFSLKVVVAGFDKSFF